MSRFSDFTKARSRAPVNKALMAAAGLYELGSDPIGARRHNAGGREQSPLDMLLSNPAVSPFMRVMHIPFLDDQDVNTSDRWDETASGSGTALTIQDAVGNKAKFTNGAGNDEHYYYELKYEKLQLIAGKDIWFWTSIAIGDVDQADMFVGLCADLASGTLFANRVDSIGFTLTDESGLLYAACAKDGSETETTTGLTLSDGIEYWVGFHSNGTSWVDFFAGIKGDEIQRVRIITDLPDDEILAPAFGLQNGEAVANSMTISDIWAFGDR